jgi:hypothetical protein
LSWMFYSLVSPTGVLASAEGHLGPLRPGPSPTVSLRLAPQVPEWGIPVDPLESHDPPSWYKFDVGSVRRSSPVPAVPPKPVRDDSSDPDGDEN